MTKDKKEKEVPQDIQDSLKSIVDSYDREGRTTRERQIRLWKKMDFYWAGYQRIYWDNVAHDWRSFNSNLNEGVSLNEAAFYDKPVNVFRAYLESIIAALSSSVPRIACTPDDADNALDISTAKGASKIAELVFKHNDAPLLFIKALFVYCTQGMIAAYNYPEAKDEYGLVDVEEHEEYDQPVKQSICPNCGNMISQEELPVDEAVKEQQQDMYGKDDSDVITDDFLRNATLCNKCEMIVNPNIENKTIIASRLTGVTSEPKSRQKIIVDGGLFVNVPNYARRQDDTPYLFYCYETHFTNVLKKYPKLRNNMDNNGNIMASAGTGYDMYERWGRLNTQYLGEYPINTPTVRNCWLRPQSFEFISEDDLRDKLYKEYPDGCKVVFVNDVFAEACNQCLDDCWTLTYNPLSEYLSFDPLGMLLTSVQEITNDLIALLLQNIEHGIPQTFADTDVLNFKQYAQTEVTPGAVYPAKARTGSSIADGFHTIKTASFPAEAMEFGDKIGALGEFVSGAMPAIFGGSQGSNVRTAAQSEQSKNQALQRLQTPWKMINYWWKNVFAKVIPAYIKTMKEDEKIVRKVGDTYINDHIRVAELQGKLGEIELESSDELPQTQAQIRSTLTQLIQLNNPQILQWMADPINAETVRQALGLSQFKTPGQTSREKQLAEIKILLQNGPMQSGGIGPDGMPAPPEPSLMPEMMVDEHPVEIEICQEWLRSSSGQLAKVENKPGYENVVAHLQVHIQMQQQMNSMTSLTDAGASQNNNASQESMSNANG